MKRVLSIVVLLVMIPLISMAQVDRRATEVVRVYFKQGLSAIDENYKNNRETLQRFADAVNELQRDTTCKVNKVRIVASVSPEGQDAINKRIVNARAEAIVNWLNKNIDKPLGYTVDLIDTDWETLIKLVEESSEVPNKSEVLDILYNTPVTVNGENLRYNKLSQLRYGVPYLWLLNNLFPELRYSNAQLDVWWDIVPELSITSSEVMNFPHEGGNGVISYSKTVDDGIDPQVNTLANWIKSIVVKDGAIEFAVESNLAHTPRSAVINVSSYGKSHTVTVNQEPAPEPEPVIEPEPEPEPECKPFYMSVQTNALYLLGIIPNVGVEFYLGKNWSIDANWQYSWWKRDSKEWYWRTYGGDLAIRKWFGKKANEKPLTGHHLGIYGQIITYDFEWGGRGYIGGRPGETLWDKLNSAVGLEYGYSLPIAKRMNLDFNLGVGYHWGEYSEYLPIDGHYVWQATKKRRYIGPTKAEISLVWLIGCSNVNAKKGGK